MEYIHSGQQSQYKTSLKEKPCRTYPQETAAAAKGTLTLRKYGTSWNSRKAGIIYHTATLPWQGLGHIFNRYTHLTAVHACLPFSGFSGDKHGLSKAKVKRNVN